MSKRDNSLDLTLIDGGQAPSLQSDASTPFDTASLRIASDPLLGAPQVKLDGSGETRVELVFIENDVADLDVLLAGIAPGKEVHVLDAGANGLEQIAAILQGRSGIDALHLVSHGQEGAASLGSLLLDAGNAGEQAALLQTIGSSLNPGADVLLYGCKVGSGDAGAHLLDQLALLTGADVAASDDLTGASALGGDWELEVQNGAVETQAVVDEQLAALYRKVLIGPVTVNFNDTSRFANTGDHAATDAIYKVNGSDSYSLTIDGQVYGTELYNDDSRGGTVELGRVDRETMVTFSFSDGQVFTPTSLAINGGFHYIYNATPYQILTFNGYDNYGLVKSQSIYIPTDSDSKYHTINFSGFTDITSLKLKLASSLPDQDGKFHAVIDDFQFSSIHPFVPDTTAPTFDTAPTAGSATLTGFTPSASIDEAGTIYYVVVESGASAPGVAQVIAGQSSNGGIPLRSGEMTVGSAPFTSGFSALTALATGTAYDVYFVAKDQAGNQQAAVTKVSTTTAIVPPNAPMLLTASDTGNSTSDGLTKDATPTYTVSGVTNGAVVTLFNDADNDGVIDAGETLASGTASGTSIELTASTMPAATYSSIKAIQSTGGSTSTASSAAGTLVIDTTAPTVTITKDKDFLKAGDTATVTFTFSEDPGGSFDINDIAVGDGSLDELSSSGKIRTALFTPTPNIDDGSAGIRVNADTYIDDAGNLGKVSNTLSISFDTLAPTPPRSVVLAADSDSGAKDGRTNDTTPTINGQAEANSTVTLYKQVGSDITEISSTTANGTGDWSITTPAQSDGVYFFLSKATDAAGNQSTYSGNTRVTIDTVAPTVDVTTSKTWLKAGETAQITFTFSEDPGSSFTWDGTSGDVVVSGGTLGAISGTGTTRTALFTPTTNTNDGTASITVAEGAYTDTAGNNGGAGVTPSLSFDTQAPTLTIDSDKSTLKAGDTATITFTFSEDPGATFSWNGAIGDVVVSGGTLGAISGTGTTRTAIFTPTTNTTDGTASITVAAGAYTDAAGNLGAAGLTPSISYDTLRPAAPSKPDLADDSDTGSSATDDRTQDTTPTLTGTAEAGSTVTIYKTDDTSTALGSGTADEAGNWSITLDLADGSYSFAAQATDTNGNSGPYSDFFSMTINNEAPTVEIETSKTTLKIGDTAAIGFIFSGSLGSGFSWDGSSGAVVVEGGTLGTLSALALNYRTGLFTPTPGVNNGTATISVTAGSYTDEFGNLGEAATLATITYDTRAPTLTIISDKNRLKAGETATLTFTFSEDPGATFSADDIDVSSGALSNFSGTGTTRTALYTPDTNVNGTVGIGVSTGNYSDAAGNPGIAVDTFLTVNTVRPTATIDIVAPKLAANESCVVNVTFSEAVTGLTKADFIVANGSMTTPASSNGGLTWSMIFTPSADVTDATNVITLDNTGVTNAAGNAGEGTTDSNNVAIDTKRPTSSIEVADSSLTAHETSQVTITFSEAVTGLTSDDLTVTDGTVGVLTSTDDGVTWTTTFTPSSDVSAATNVITLDNYGVQDAYGNTGSGTTDSNTFAIDTLAPDAPPAPDLADASDLGFSATDNLTHDTTPTFTGTADTDVVSITLYEGSTVLGSVAPAEDGTWSITSTTLGAGAHAIIAKATDAAGNESDVSNSLIVDIDTTTPTLTITSDQSALKAGDTTEITFTFSEDPGSSFTWDGTSGDIVVSGGTLSAISGSGLTRTALFTPATDTNSGTASITVTAGSYTDAAGNNGGAGTTPSLSFDTKAPDAPAALTLDADSDLGTSNTDALTSDDTPTITGTAEVGSTVTLYEGSTVLGSIVADDKGDWSITSAKLDDDTHTLTAKAVDAAGNESATSATLEVTVDTTAPTVTIASDKSALKIGDTATFTFTFSEDPGATFSIDDLTATGGKLSDFGGSGLTRTVILTPTADIDGGTASVSLADDLYTDEAGNDGSGIASASISVDTKAPTLAITSDESALSIGGTAEITFTFSEDPGSSFTWDGTSGDVVVSGGTLGAISGSGLTRTAIFTPTSATNGGSASITVTAGAYTDAAGNNGGAGITPSLSFDTKAPDAPAALLLDADSDLGTSNTDALTSDDTPTITGIAEAGSIVTLYEGSAELGSVTADGNGDWAITSATLDEGSHTLIAKAVDAAGNESDVSLALEMDIDTTTPTLTITSDESALKAGDTTEITFTFSEDPGATFTVDDITVSGGTLSSISGSGLTRTATFTPDVDTNDGKASITVAAGTYTDPAGNNGGAGTTPSLSFDTKAPDAPAALVLDADSDLGTSSTDALTSDDTPTITGTAEVGSTVTLYEGSTVLGSVIAGSKGEWSITSATLDDDTHALTAKAVDAAGNESAASATLEVTIDTTAPTVSVTSDKSALKIGDTATFTFTFTEDPGATFSIDDLTATGGKLSDFGGSGLTRTVILTPSADINGGTASVSLADDLYTDAAGNDGSGNTSASISVDTKAPTLTITSDESALNIGDTAEITFTFSEDPGSSFTWDGTSGDVVVSGGTLGAISGSGLTRTALFTPTPGTNGGSASITVTAGAYTDAAGNNGGAGTTPSLSFDTKAPDAPAALVLDADSDLGTSSTDALTSDDTPTITGTAEAGSTVTLYEGSAELGSVTADVKGGWSITSTLLDEGSHTLTAKAVDAAGNESDVSNSLIVDIDTTAPTLTITSDQSALKASDTAEITFTFSEDPGATFTVDDITVSGGTLSAISGSGLTRTATFTPDVDTNDGKASITVAAGTYTDAAGNNGGAGTTPSLSFDTKAPDAPSALTLDADSDLGTSDTDALTSDNTPTISGTAEAGSTVTLYEGSEALGSVIADGNGDWSITSATLDDDTHALTAKAVDAAGNESAASATLEVTIDTTAPTVSVTSDKSALKIGDTATFTFTFTEDPGATFSIDDLTATGGKLSDFGGSGLTRTVILTPTADIDGGTASVSLADDLYTDAAGNDGSGTTSASISVDTKAPTLTITSDESALNIGGTAEITFTFNEDPGSSFTWDGTSGDVVVSGGTLGAISGSGLTRTATFTPDVDTNDGKASITVAAGTYTDPAGNNGGAGTTPSLSFDTKAPDAPAALLLDADSDLGTSNTDALTSDDTPTITGIAEAGSIVTLYEGSAELGSVTADGNGDWAITSTLLDEGSHTLTAKAVDAAGNESDVSNSLIVDIDTTTPTLTITSDDGALKAGESTTLTFTFSEDPGATFTWDGNIGDVSFNNGTLSAMSGSGLTRTAIFTPDADVDGSASISVAATSWTDAAGNAGGGAISDTIDIDTLSPSLIITTDKAALKAGDTATITFTFSEDPGASFDGSDITVDGGELSDLSGSGLIRTATFTPTPNTADGSASIVVDVDAYTDAAGNTGTGAELKALAFDTLIPTVTSVSSVTADGSYSVGDTIEVLLTFSETVKVTGTPLLSLDTGTANYSSGDGTDTLTFTYTVQAGDISGDLDYTGIDAVALNGGTILDLDGNAAVLTLAVPGEDDSLGANADFVIDTAAPEFVSASVNGDSLVLSYADDNALDDVNPPLPGSFTVMDGTVAILVTDVAVDAAGKTLTLTLDGAVADGDVVKLSYADPTGGDDTHAIQDGAGNDAATLTAVAVTNATPAEETGNGGNKGTTETVDGVDVTTTTTTENGVTQTIVSIAPVPPTRSEDANTPNGSLADIPLAADANGETLLQIGLPSGVGVTAAGAAPADTTLGLRDQLIAASQPRLSDSAFTQVLQDGIDRYVAVVEDPSQVAVKTLTLTQGASAPTQPIVITGAAGTGEDDQGHPLRQEALVIDARSLPAGTVIELEQVEFAVVIGDVIVQGGDGRNYVFGNDGSQTIFLGEGDDELHGGGGDDVVASSLGDDRLFGDDGADRVIGGIGNDVLEGGAGDDILQGGASGAGSWTFGIGADGQLLSHFTPRDALLAAPGDQHGSLWAYDPVNDILADSRVAFMEAPVAHLATVAALYKAVTQNLPTIAELNQLAALGQDSHQLAERAYAVYAQNHPAPADLTDEVSALIAHVLGAEAATPDLVQQGVEFLQSGGARADALLYLVNDARFKAGMSDMDGTFHLAQDLQVSELDWDATSGNDVLRGGDGNDILAGGSGDDLLDGGAGNDTAVLKFSAERFTLSLDADANVVLHNQLTGESDVLVSVEFLQFGDEVFALEVPSQVAGTQQPLAEFLQVTTEEELVLVGVQHEA